MTSGRTAVAGRHRWAWKIGRVAGVPIFVHFTLTLLMVWVIWVTSRSGGPVVGRVFFLLGLFASVLLHEIGHSLVAIRFGIHPTEIVLYPFGGIARMRSMGAPTQEFWISLAGPATNLILGALLFGVLFLRHTWIPITLLPEQPHRVLQWLMMANFTLALFNLLPAFPLDGGRVVRALLARRLDMLQATTIAANIGQGIAILMGLAALLMSQFILMFIAFFIFISAGQEVLVQRAITIMEGQHVADAMITHFEILDHADSLGQAADLLLATHQQDFPVRAGGEIVGLLTRPDLVRGLANHGPRAYVSGSASREFVRLARGDALAGALERMRSASERVALVFGNDPSTGGHLMGMLTEENVKEFLQVQEAIPQEAQPEPGPQRRET